ncbi:MAG: thioredoxin-dependent thiol peroxidase [Bacteroidetes bacterium]|nr:MAG: thioredoxin-dependent thiol peroxidase [Bacteroidota bacterium]
MELIVGQQAPAFESKDQHGKTVKLSDFQGKKLIMYFYPKDDTPGCTAQSCNLRDNYESLQKQGFQVIGISSDDEKSHQKFIAKYNLPFNLLADTDQSIHQKYGTWGEKQMFGKKYMGTFRTTFVLDEQGKILEIIKKVDTAEHTKQIVK